MSNLEHYFENLLFHDQDVNGDWNKKPLTEQEQEVAEDCAACAEYVLSTVFLNREEFLKFIHKYDVDYKEKFNEAFNTINDAYQHTENMKEILEQYLLNNACCNI